MKIDEIGGAAYNSRSAGTKYVLNISYDKTNYLFWFHSVYFDGKYAKNKCPNQAFQ